MATQTIEGSSRYGRPKRTNAWSLLKSLNSEYGKPFLDLLKIFGIHLFLSGVACFCFGAFHVTGLFGLGIWVSNPYGLTGRVQFVNPAWGYFQQEIYGRIGAGLVENQSLSKARSEIPKKLAFYDYIGNNSAKGGGLFRAGSMDNGDGIIVRLLGHLIFRDKEGRKTFCTSYAYFFLNISSCFGKPRHNC
ncbi:hypothetical protein DVH24_021676 [Malus domestica]|uniref:Uncharacterized protein n=1 Tax=Malus domestica TaxID=3750 RepID=A0A498K1S5_MALDO|nr:hypothetical protein DVH24_021676 [Malus domestica]